MVWSWLWINPNANNATFIFLIFVPIFGINLLNPIHNFDHIFNAIFKICIIFILIFDERFVACGSFNGWVFGSCYNVWLYRGLLIVLLGFMMTLSIKLATADNFPKACSLVRMGIFLKLLLYLLMIDLLVVLLILVIKRPLFTMYC